METRSRTLSQHGIDQSMSRRSRSELLPRGSKCAVQKVDDSRLAPCRTSIVTMERADAQLVLIDEVVLQAEVPARIGRVAHSGVCGERTAAGGAGKR